MLDENLQLTTVNIFFHILRIFVIESFFTWQVSLPPSSIPAQSIFGIKPWGICFPPSSAPKSFLQSSEDT